MNHKLKVGNLILGVFDKRVYLIVGESIEECYTMFSTVNDDGKYDYFYIFDNNEKSWEIIS